MDETERDRSRAEHQERHEDLRKEVERHRADRPAGQEDGLHGFPRFAHAVSVLSGKPVVFAAATALVIGWAVSGPIFGFSETWQLVINTGTTIITFLMVFLIQATQNRDNQALHLKLDELIEATREAHDDMIDLEDQSDEVLEERRDEMHERMESARSGAASNGHRTRDH